jgi:hypothetical protein
VTSCVQSECSVGTEYTVKLLRPENADFDTVYSICGGDGRDGLLANTRAVPNRGLGVANRDGLITNGVALDESPSLGVVKVMREVMAGI